MAPIHVKPFVGRNKNDAADAQAIAEAASRPTIGPLARSQGRDVGRADRRFVAVKSIEKQASAMTFKARDLLVGHKDADHQRVARP